MISSMRLKVISIEQNTSSDTLLISLAGKPNPKGFLLLGGSSSKYENGTLSVS